MNIYKTMYFTHIYTELNLISVVWVKYVLSTTSKHQKYMVGSSLTLTYMNPNGVTPVD